MSFPGWRLHKLSRELKGHWSVMVSGNWRLTFAFEGDASMVALRILICWPFWTPNPTLSAAWGQECGVEAQG
jgi:hypothetical protein